MRKQEIKEGYQVCIKRKKLKSSRYRSWVKGGIRCVHNEGSKYLVFLEDDFYQYVEVVSKKEYTPFSSSSLTTLRHLWATMGYLAQQLAR